jgi:YgiT-type zinc finger domain-containing protein
MRGMETRPPPICREHQVQKEWRTTTFEYEDQGISIRVPNVYAWVCPVDNEASFVPDTVDELIAAVRELLEAARRARDRRAVFTEYFVSIG